MHRQNVSNSEVRSAAPTRTVVTATVGGSLAWHGALSGPVATVVEAIPACPSGGASTMTARGRVASNRGRARSSSGRGRASSQNRGGDGGALDTACARGRRRSHSASTPPSPALRFARTSTSVGLVKSLFKAGVMQAEKTGSASRSVEPQEPQTLPEAPQIECAPTDSACTSARRQATSRDPQSRNQIRFRKNQQHAESSVWVAVRFRPLTVEEACEGAAYRVRTDGRIVESTDLTYSFELDRAFAAEVSQGQVYSEVGYSVIADVLQGYNGTVLTYGQTGSGKTYCMFGPSPDRGIIPRAARQIFNAIRSGADDVNFVLRCSLLEVYCEQLRDLLDPSNRDLRVQESPQRGVVVEGLTQECVEREEDVLDILNTGAQMRVVACTKINNMSSRSHVLLLMSCTQTLADGSEKVGRLSLVDLAGSERIGNSGALTAGGTRLQEATKINCSLTALGHVIQALLEKQSHVPYRNSQLTRVLRETLGGNCKTALIVTCSAAARHSGETLSSLRFATRARLVRNRVKVNLIRSPEQLTDLVAQLQRELISVRKEAGRLGLNIESMVSTPLGGSPLFGSLAVDGTESGANGCEDSITDDESGTTISGQAMKKGCNEVEGDEIRGRRVEALFAEVHELEAALEIQGQELMAIMTRPVPREVSHLGKELNGRIRVQRQYWRTAVLELDEKRDIEKISELEKEVANREEELAHAFERRRSHRLLARGQISAISRNCLGDKMFGKDQVGESTMSFGQDRSSCSGPNPRPRRSYMCTAGHKASKVVKPINRRSIERRSVGGTSSASSRSGTPHGNSPRPQSSQLDDVCSSPTVDRAARVNLSDPCNASVSTDLTQKAGGSCLSSTRKSLSASNSVQVEGIFPKNEEGVCSPQRHPGCNQHGRLHLASLHDPVRGVATAWSDMVDEEKPVDCVGLSASNCADGGATVTSNVGGKVSSAEIDEEQQLKDEILELRKAQEQARHIFEEKWQREEDACRRAQAEALQHQFDLEEQLQNCGGAIPQLRTDLKHLDMALAEAEAVEDALRLASARLSRAGPDQDQAQQSSFWRDRMKLQKRPAEFDTFYACVSVKQ